MSLVIVPSDLDVRHDGKHYILSIHYEGVDYMVFCLGSPTQDDVNAVLDAVEKAQSNNKLWRNYEVARIKRLLDDPENEAHHFKPRSKPWWRWRAKGAA